MNAYEERRAARIERMRAMAEKKREFASQNDLSLYGEEKSGIPMGQPILVGHHSEKRHRRHLERIENKVRKGYEAAKQADLLEERADSAERRTAIDSDNPEALELLRNKIEKLEKYRDMNRRMNQLIRLALDAKGLQKLILTEFPDYPDVELISSKLWELDFRGKRGVPDWWFTNTGAEIRRLKKRLAELTDISEDRFQPIEGDGLKASLVDGRIILEFDSIPTKEVRDVIKTTPFTFKWSSRKKVWCRKHTPTTNSEYFKKLLTDFVKGYKNEQPK